MPMLLTVLSLGAARPAPLRPTASGPVVGLAKTSSAGVGVDAFLGIPYAAPPLGARRFLAPEPHAAWTHARNASRAGPPCMQLGGLGMFDGLPPLEKFSEDCLSLNVFAPAGALETAAPLSHRPPRFAVRATRRGVRFIFIVTAYAYRAPGRSDAYRSPYRTGQSRLVVNPKIPWRVGRDSRVAGAVRRAGAAWAWPRADGQLGIAEKLTRDRDSLIAVANESRSVQCLSSLFALAGAVGDADGR